MIKDLILFVLISIFHLTLELHRQLNRLIRFVDENMETDTSTYKNQLLNAKAKDWLDSL